MSSLSNISVTYNYDLTLATFACEYSLDYSTSYRRIGLKFGGYAWSYDDYLAGGASYSELTFERTNLNTRPGETYSWTVKVQYCDMHDDPSIASNWHDSALVESGTTEAICDVSATVVYDPNGGTGGPGTRTIRGESSNPIGANLSFTIPSSVPTRSGYSFAGWLFPSGYTLQPGQSAVLWATQSGTSYVAVTQWGTLGARIYIGNGQGWDEYTAYIGNGQGWDAVTPNIGDGTDWD